ncbi:MAG TPA: ATP-binding protein [Pyrinomonadaceae bacterium]|nr:ATP-binding protein [Pyrinomonadaceae bacterium]
MEEREKKKLLKRPRRLAPLLVIGGLVVFLLLTLIILQSSNIWKNFSVQTASDTLLFYGLSSLNFIAFIIFAFIFIRSLLKLSRERKALQLGAKIKTRLLLYFIAVSLLPIVAMAGFSYLYLNRALERWFSQFPIEVMREARQIQTTALENRTRELDETARMLAFTLDSRRSDITEDDLRQLNERGGLARIEIALPSGSKIKVEDDLPDDVRADLNAAIEEFKAGTYDRNAGKFQITGADLSDGSKLIMVSSVREEADYSKKVASSLAEFDRLKQNQQDVRQIGISTLGLLTFLLLFASSWAAFYIARGIAQPIKALAEGADEITKGNLTHRVDVLAEDELELLVKAFNQMAEQLEENRANLELGAAELHRRQKYIETVLQSLSTGVISFDSENRVNTINDAAKNMLRLGDKPCIQCKLEELVAPENLPVLERLLGRAQRIGQASEQTALTLESGGHESLPVALMAAALRGEERKEHSGVVLVLEDLSELLSAQRSAAWAEVARRMAHEIKNPLTPIQLSAERIAKRFAEQNGDGQTAATAAAATAAVVKDGTETILREVHSLKAMVDEFSRFARLPKVSLEQGNINEVLRQTLALYEDRLDNVRTEMYLTENLPDSMVDREQLKRVFVNLIENALEAFDGAAAEKIISVKTFYNAEKDLITIDFGDNGGGIAPQDFTRIFQPYFSTKGRGTGLGLAIVQRIIMDHGGKIRASANLPKGAKFIIELPVNV